MTAATSLAETLAAALGEHQWRDWSCSCGAVNAATCTTEDEHLSVVLAEAARAWLVTRLAERGPEVIAVHRLQECAGRCSCGSQPFSFYEDHAAHVVAALAGVLTDE